MSVADSQRSVFPLTKSAPVSLVPNFYRCHPGVSAGFASPSQLYSPAPVRSGKTPMSPVAPIPDPHHSFLLEQSDDEEEEDKHVWLPPNSNDDKSPFHTTNVTSASHRPLPSLFSTSLALTPTEMGKNNSSSSKLPTEPSSLISSVNLSTFNRPKYSVRTENRSDDARLAPKTSCDHLFNRFRKSYSTMDLDPLRYDEEFSFRMQAEPFSLSRDSVASGTFCLRVPCDEPEASEDSDHATSSGSSSMLTASSVVDHP